MCHADMTPLQALIQDRIAALGISYRSAAGRADGLISHSSINFLAKGQMRAETLSRRLQQGLALALDLPLTRIEAAVAASGGPTEAPFELPPEASRLTPSQRRLVKSLVRELVTSS